MCKSLIQATSVFGALLIVFSQTFAQSNNPQAYVADIDKNQRLFLAAKTGSLADLRVQLAQGLNLNTQDSQGYTALIYASYYGHEKIVDELLTRGADPCTKDKRGNTATLGAIFKGHLRIAQTLLGRQCGVNEQNSAGQTALMFAALFGRNEIASELLKHGADSSLKDDHGFDARQLAAGQGNEGFLKLVAKTQPDIPPALRP